MITITVTGDASVAAAFKQAGSRVRQLADKAVVDQAEALRSYIVTQELSGQMLRIRRRKDRGLRYQMTYRVRRTDVSVIADVHPKQGSPLWMLGSGMKEQEIDVGKHVRSFSRRDQWGFVATRQLKSRTNIAYRQKAAGISFVKAYRRRHHLTKIPFMEAAWASHRDQIRSAFEAAVATGAAQVQAEIDTGGGI